MWAGLSRTFLPDGMWESGRGSWQAASCPFLKALWLSLHAPETPDRPWNPLTFSPPQLTVAEGETATFTCSFSNTSEHFVLNLYRMSPSNQTVKLAAFPKDSGQVHRDPRFRVTWLPNGRDFEMSVLAAQRNDSGTYLCGVIYLPPETQIHESPHAELMVTGAGVRLRVGQGRAQEACKAQWQGLSKFHPWTRSHTQNHSDQWLRASVFGSTPDPLLLREGREQGLSGCGLAGLGEAGPCRYRTVSPQVLRTGQAPALCPHP